MNDRLDRKKIKRKATIKFLDKLTQEAKQLAKGVNNDDKHKLNSNKGVITYKLDVLKRLDNEIMDLSTDEEQISNIMVASTEIEAEVQETLSVIEEVLTDKFIVHNIEDVCRYVILKENRQITIG